MKIVRIVDLQNIIDHFEKEYAKNSRIYNAWDSFVSNASGVSFIDELKLIQKRALEESKGNTNAFLSDQLFVKYTQIILNPGLVVKSPAYEAIYRNHMQVAITNRFILSLHEDYCKPYRGQDSYMCNLVFNLARTRHQDLAWEAMHRLSRQKIKLTSDEIRFILDNRECAMGIAMCFAEFSKTDNRKQFCSMLMNELSCDDSVLREHLISEENYNHKHFDLHPAPVTRNAHGFVAALKTLRQSGKQLEAQDIECAMQHLHACNEYAHAVRSLHGAHDPFDDESRQIMTPILADMPHRALHLMQVTRYVRQILEDEGQETTCLTSEQLQQLSDEHLAWLSSMLEHMPATLRTAENVVRLYLHIDFGDELIHLLPCLAVKSSQHDLQNRFDHLLACKHYMHKMDNLPLLAEQSHYSSNYFDQVLRHARHADKLIAGLLIWCHAYEKYCPDTLRRSSLVTYKGVLQDRRKTLIDYFHDVRNAMYQYPERADAIVKRAVLTIKTTTLHGNLKPVEQIVAELMNGNESRNQYQPFMFSSHIYSATGSEDNNTMRKSFAK